ncbi:hypothetical protein ElyMa_005448900 [Elysia marginata]|uniref:Uncharacterized protein n=1 Tax=Elysia marginata TaxID=1093978 RepID=A0AAV4EPP3_9GAST|nr:hypothetical protein ElyMa_005448900 [Elysia marginata]
MEVSTVDTNRGGPWSLTAGGLTLNAIDDNDDDDDDDDVDDDDDDDDDDDNAFRRDSYDAVSKLCLSSMNFMNQ